VLLIFSLVELAVRLALTPSPAIKLARLLAERPAAKPTGRLIFIALPYLRMIPKWESTRPRSQDRRHSKPTSSSYSRSIHADFAEESQIMIRETSHMHVLKARLASILGSV